ncbi:putative leucine-rich repeat-containing protein DDB_G0290503 [Montipora capricornis]|uniref:putative leucine-rich repeat-containing protein DDB_G0290503 n=1 Tax=Montipora capricornis TaxID=246305 RepID=UPI0035F19385
MSSQEITSDSGICLSAEKQKSKPSSRGIRSNSDGEHSSEEENGHVRRCSQNTSRFSVRVSRQKSESDSSDDDHVRDKPAETDSGINLKKRHEKDLSVKEIFHSKISKTSLFAHGEKRLLQTIKSTGLSPRETRASALRKQAQLKKAASSDIKKIKKDKVFRVNQHNQPEESYGDKDKQEKNNSDNEAPISNDKEEIKCASQEMRGAINDQLEAEESSSAETPSLDLSSMPSSVEDFATDKMVLQNSFTSGKTCEQSHCLKSVEQPAPEKKVDIETRKDTDYSKLVEEKPASKKVEEKAHPNYSDDSFEEELEVEGESFEEPERTPTFDFNLSPQSIAVSDWEDSNKVLLQSKVPHIEDQDTESDASEIDSESLTSEEGILGEKLQRKQSERQFFNLSTNEIEHEAVNEKHNDADDGVEDKCLGDVTFIEPNNEAEIFTDRELDRMDMEVFDLLRSPAQRTKNHVAGSQQRSVVYAGDDDIGDITPDTRNRKVRITVEPEVFLVPFSSREFDEPFFDDTEGISSRNQSESSQKNLILESRLKSVVEELDQNEEEGQENGTWKDYLVVEANGSHEKHTRINTEANLKDGVLRAALVDSDDMKPDIAKRGTEGISDDGCWKDVSAFQNQLIPKNILMDPCSEEFVDDLEHLLNDAEEDIRSKSSLKADTAEVNQEAISSTISICTQDMKGHKTSFHDNQEAKLPLELVASDGNSSNENQRTSGDAHGEPFRDVVDDSLESVEEDIPEEIISGDLDGDDVYEPCDFSLGNDAVNDGTEIVASNVSICQPSFTSDSKDANIALECESISISLKTIETVVPEKSSQDTDVLLDVTLKNHLEKTNDQAFLKVFVHDETFLPEEEGKTVISLDDVLQRDEGSFSAVFSSSDDEGQDVHNALVSGNRSSNYITKVVEHDEVTVGGFPRSTMYPENVLEKDEREIGFEYLDEIETLYAEIHTLKEHNGELKLELEEKSQAMYTIECMIKSVNLENENLLSQVENIENELQNALSEKQDLELELSAQRADQEVNLDGMPEYHTLVTEVNNLRKHNEQLQTHLEKSELQLRNIESVVEQLNFDNEKLLERIDCLKIELSEKGDPKVDEKVLLEKSQRTEDEISSGLLKERDLEFKLIKRSAQDLALDKDFSAEVKTLKKQNEQLVLHLEESKMQSKNMEGVVEELNFENEGLLQKVDDLETIIFEKKAVELDVKRRLEKYVEENEALRNCLKENKNESTSSSREEIMEIAAERKILKDIHSKIDGIRKDLCVKGGVTIETSLERTVVDNSKLSLLQGLRSVMSSVVAMDDDLKDTILAMQSDSVEHKRGLDTELAGIKDEYGKMLGKNNAEIKSLKTQNDELKLKLQERGKESSNVECKTESCDAEKRELLEQVQFLENEIKTVLDEKRDVEKELKKKNNEDEYRERELSNLRKNMMCQEFNWEEMDATLNQVWNDKQSIEKELDFTVASLEETEAAKLNLVKEMDRMKLQVEKLKEEQATQRASKDYAYLREVIEHLNGSLSLSSRNEARLKKELEFATFGASSVSSNEQLLILKDEYKARIEKLEKENTLLFEKLEWGEKSEGTTVHLEKLISNVQEELRRFQEKSDQALKNGGKAKKDYKKLRNRLIRNEGNITALTKSFQRGTHETKEMHKELKRQVQNDVEQIKEFIEKKVGNEQFVNYIQEMKVLLEQTLHTVQKNQANREVNGSNLDRRLEKTQQLENAYQELKGMLDINEAQLGEKDKIIEELKLQLRNERESNMSLQSACDNAEVKAKQNAEEKACEITNLRELLVDSEGKAQSANESVVNITKYLESAKEALAQKEEELTNVRASLCEGDQLLVNFTKSLEEMQCELEDTKRVLIDKDMALNYVERYAEMLIKMVKTQDHEILMTNKLVTAVVENVDRVGKVLESKLLGKDVEKTSQETMTDNEVVESKGKESIELETLKYEFEASLKEKDQTIQQLEASIIQLKQDLAFATSSEEEKEDALQKLMRAFESQRKKLELSNQRTNKIADEVADCFGKELTELKRLLTQQEGEVKKLKGSVASRDSKLREQSSKLEEVTLLLLTKENALDVTEQELAQTDKEKRSLMDHLKTKMAEIRGLQEALDNKSPGRRRSHENYPGVIAHMEDLGKSDKYTEQSKKEDDHKLCDYKEGTVTYFENAMIKLGKDIAENNVLRPGKNEEINLQLRKEESVDNDNALFHQLEQTFKLDKRNVSEKESSLRKESNSLEEKLNVLGTLLCQKRNETKELKPSFLEKTEESTESKMEINLNGNRKDARNHG